MAEVDGKPILGLRERKKQRTRAELIEAAVELCTRQGYEATTVDQIAAVADVSPRTFSRYFATKDAVVLASIDDIVELVAVQLTRQPHDLTHLDALCKAHIEAFVSTKTGAVNGLTSERLLAAARIINSSPSLRHLSGEFREDAVNAALAQRMGVARDDKRLKLVACVWSAIVSTAMADVGKSDWASLTVEAIVSRVEETYSMFLAETAGARQPA
ncbi:TetR family transcriptional regulator [Mycobacterium sp. CPCC 205372]|uniref:TetR family transcriptional regulator n=1 Tax=Mycobacterium hippophais TaxID=3016340 RepID=A0ABT4PMX0_9MYCO|nr:TetR/AcrR family transcriptional regulator [Mycobacterium hippophais]MCZ8377912.1 TetR family transcriptional regulator [Mycobacterium hippophais]